MWLFVCVNGREGGRGWKVTGGVGKGEGGEGKLFSRLVIRLFLRYSEVKTG